MKNVLMLAIIFIGFVSAAHSQNNPDQAGMPQWLKSHFEFMTEGTGRWITDNSKFKSENEPFDEYGTEWAWGVGKKSIKGRLFGLKDKKEVATFWEYRVFWHPLEKRAVFQQFGAGGVFGIGEMRVIGLPDGKSENLTEATFYNPDGTNRKDLHKLTENKDEHTTQSFSFENGSWELRRIYIWRRAPK